MARIRVFDPACGSGNFLVIAYKEMRAIESEVNKRRGEPQRRSDIPVTNLRGIELRDFPAEIARLALIIAEYACGCIRRARGAAKAPRHRHFAACAASRHRLQSRRADGAAAMIIEGVPFQMSDTAGWPETRHAGETGHALWRTLEVGNLRVRMVEYSPGYSADHWCSRGHVLLVMRGTLRTELADGRVFEMTTGCSYQVAENAEPHRSSTEAGATLFIVD